MSPVHAFAAETAGAELKPFSYELGPLGTEEVDIKVHYWVIPHSLFSILRSEWQIPQ